MEYPQNKVVPVITFILLSQPQLLPHQPFLKLIRRKMLLLTYMRKHKALNPEDFSNDRNLHLKSLSLTEVVLLNVKINMSLQKTMLYAPQSIYS